MRQRKRQKELQKDKTVHMVLRTEPTHTAEDIIPKQRKSKIRAAKSIRSSKVTIEC